MTRALAVFLAILVAGCAGGTGTPSAAPGTAVGTDATTGATPDDAPLVLTSTPDTDAAVEGTVTLEDGGTIVAEAADGTTFELVVPPAAVAEDTEITLTPLDDVGGLGTDGPVHAVQLEPDGLVLFAPARLTITPPEPIPIEEQLAFEAAGDGTDVQPAIIDPASEPMVLLLEHFSSGGMGSFSAEQQATFLARSATNAEERIRAEMADRLGGERRRQLTGESEAESQPDVSDLIDEFRREVVERRRQAAALSCDHLYAYVKTLISFERQLQLLGAGDEETYNAMMDESRRVLDERYPECERQKIEECRAEEDPAILIRFWLANREAGRSGQPEVTAAEQERAEQLCKPQGLMFEFSGSRTIDGEPASWHYWGLKCADEEHWQIWEVIEGPTGSGGTGPPPGAYGPYHVTFGENGTMTGVTWPGAPDPNPVDVEGATLFLATFGLTPPDPPTEVHAQVQIAGGEVVAPVEPWDGSFGECAEADAG